MTKLKPVELARLLREIAGAIESGDSLEGSIQYLIPEDGDYEYIAVEAAFRVGNQDGQGGMVVL